MATIKALTDDEKIAKDMRGVWGAIKYGIIPVAGVVGGILTFATIMTLVSTYPIIMLPAIVVVGLIVATYYWGKWRQHQARVSNKPFKWNSFKKWMV